MDTELEDYVRANKKLALDVSTLTMKQRALLEEIKTQKQALKREAKLSKRYMHSTDTFTETRSSNSNYFGIYYCINSTNMSFRTIRI